MAGFLAHRLYQPSTGFGDRLGTLLRYAIGIVLMLPFVLLDHHALREIENDDTRVSAAYLLAAVSVGGGVAIGHFADRAEQS
jgi:hypothetical protein